MRTMRRRLLAQLVAASLGTAVLAAEAVEFKGASFAGRNIIVTEPLVIDFDRFPAAGEGTLAVFLGATDIGGLMRVSGPAQVTYPSAETPLPVGPAEVIIYLVKDASTWQELKRLPITIVAPPAPPATRFQPKADLTGNATSQRARASDQPETRSVKDVGGLQGGLGVTHAGEGWDARAQVNVVGASERRQALRFGERGADAEKIDLASYLLEAGTADTRVSLGHIAYGNNPLLLSGISNRGVVASQRFSQSFDFSMSVQNGSTIVGFDDLAGFYDVHHHYSAGTLGWEVLPARPRALRLEFTYLDAAIKPAQASINAAQILDSSKSRGWGLRLIGASPSGALRGEAAYAQSRYLAAPDAFTPEGPSPKRSAYLLDGNYQVLQNRELAPGWLASLALRARRDYAEPLYRSLGAGYAADYVQDVLGASSSIGQIQANAQIMRRHDNVDEAPALVRNNIENSTLSLSVPVGSLLAQPGAQPAPWWPAMALSWQRTHQFASNLPTGLTAADVADIQTTAQSASLSWQAGPVNWGASFVRTLQDNRQPGRENADIHNYSTSLNVAWRVNNTLSVNAAYGPTRSFNTDTGLTRKTRNPQFGFNWTFLDVWQVAGSYSLDRSFDTQRLADGRGNAASTMLSRRFMVPNPFGQPLPLQVGLRHFVSYNVMRTTQGVLDFENRQRTSGFGINLSMSLF